MKSHLGRGAFVRVGFVGMALTLLTAGCQKQIDDMTTRRTEFKARLSGATEVPPTASGGEGELEATYNPSNHELDWRLRFSGLTGTVTAAHFHGPAGPGANAPVAVPINSTFVGTWQRGEVKLTDTQAADLLAGRWYVNIHTAQFPGGEIRGQVVRDR
jgi:hypothetical protein